MNRWAEWVILVILVGFVVFEAAGRCVGSATHTIVLQ
jgi:hypothetical protein